MSILYIITYDVKFSSNLQLVNFIYPIRNSSRHRVGWLLIPSTAVYKVLQAIFARSGDVAGCETARQ